MELVWTQGRLNRSDSVSEGFDKLCRVLGQFCPVRAIYGPCVWERARYRVRLSVITRCPGGVRAHTRGKLTG